MIHAAVWLFIRSPLRLLIGWSLLASTMMAEPPATPSKRGADLLKTDIMAVFAHPDDETGRAATLAYYALGRNAVVANVYCTRGEGGGNMVGTQWGPALATLREAELRDCLSILGVRYCYFLDQVDWAYTESVAATLHKWGKEETLERLVRFVRALRPDVMVTMNPAPTPGQHGHHQAAAVLATEAFSAAADGNLFPLQLSREGLTVWQPRKLYFGGGSTGMIAAISVGEPLAGGKTPAQLAGQALVNHRSQAFGNFGNSPGAPRPQRFTLVRSFVPVAGKEDDLLHGLPVEMTTEFHFTKAQPQAELELEFQQRPAVVNYRKWIKEQGIEHVGGQFRADMPLVSGEPNSVTLGVVNHGKAAIEGELRFETPSGWVAESAQKKVTVAAGTTAPISLRVSPPSGGGADADLRGIFTANGHATEATARVHPLPRTRVVRLKSAPPLDGSDHGWEDVPMLQIAPTNLFQGKVADEADSSATFRLAHDGTTFYVDVQVRDDVVVTNIAPNDIKGHWRSDSIEICLDPLGGAEHTMGCFKLGIFPFDTTGVVRASRDADANQGPAEETAPKTRLVSRRTAEGYRIQAAIPFDEIGVPRGGKRRLGFNLIIYDGDKRDAALGENINKSRIAWAPRSGVMGRPEDWGRIDLE
jgi:LmbE family N-acetylglucosaminyl deacetylase